MRSKKNVETTRLKKGETLKKEFNNYVDMATSAVDWTLFCTYQLQPNFSKGVHKILQLPTMQIAYSNLSGGIMFDYVSPKECLTFSVMQNISKKACIEQMKLETGMITIVDDKKVYNFLCSDKVELIDISLNKNADPLLLKQLRCAVDKYYLDGEQNITKLIKNFIDAYGDGENTILNTDISMQIEKEITETMLELLNTQEPHTPQFTKSEKVALKIKKRLFRHMDHQMTVSSLAENYNISIKSLQNAFNSLFGISPKYFMRVLKLNLVHHELVQSDTTETTVQKIAQKWGFMHMGHFSKYYTEFFGENPSITLKESIPAIDGMKQHCVERQEEIV